MDEAMTWDEAAAESKKTPASDGYAPREIRSELIRIAALLATCYNLPSDLVDDYPQKTYSAPRVAGMMGKAHEYSKKMAYQLRQVSDSIKTDPIGPSSTDYEAWLETDPYYADRLENAELKNGAGYEIWRRAWMACEREHGIRKA